MRVIVGLGWIVAATVLAGADEVGPPEWRAALPRLQQEDLRLRRQAAKQLAAVNHPDARAALLKAATDEDPAVRDHAWSGLAAFPHPDAVPALVAALKEADLGLRDRVIVALGKLGGPRVVAELVRVLDGGEETWRIGAAAAVARLGEPAALPGLLRMLRDPRPSLREAAVGALGHLDDPAAHAGLLVAVEDDDVGVRRGAVAALARLHDARLFPTLVDRLADDDIEVRRSAASGLVGIRDKAALPALRKALRDQDPVVRGRVAVAAAELTRVPPADLAAEVAVAMEDPLIEIRLVAVGLIGRLRHHRVIPVLMRAMADEYYLVRHRAARALDAMGLASIPDTLQRAARQQDAIFIWMVGALKQVGDPQGAPTAIRGLGDPRDDVRQAAMDLMGQLGSELETAVTAMIGASRDRRPYVRQWAAQALGAFQDARAVPVLKGLREDRDPGVALAARQALEALGAADQESPPAIRQP